MKKKFKVTKKLMKSLGMNFTCYKGATFIMSPGQVLSTEEKQRLYLDHLNFLTRFINGIDSNKG